MMVEYYRQRASAGGLIITESSHPSHDSRGYLGAPGIYTDAHVEGWRRITDAVHAEGGSIVMQIAHDGRQSRVDLSDGKLPIALSVVPFEGQAFTQDGWVPVSPHRALELHEIPALVESFRRGAERAKEAGFDGIELHNANGYFADTFLQDGTNKRTDAYGGSIENRTRGDADAVAFGRYFTSNPDLPERFRHGLPLTPYVRDAFWGGDERHYIDFPPYQQLQTA